MAEAVVPEVFGQLALGHYLILSAFLFAIGLAGFVTRRNMIVMFLCTELMFQAAVIALAAFGRFHLDLRASHGDFCPDDCRRRSSLGFGLGGASLQTTTHPRCRGVVGDA